MHLSNEKRKELKTAMRKVIATNPRGYDIDETSLDILLDRWSANKDSIYKCFRKQPQWNEDELCLIIKDKVYRNADCEKARRIFDVIIKTLLKDSPSSRCDYISMFYELSKDVHLKEPDCKESHYSEDKIMNGCAGHSELYKLLFEKCHLQSRMKLSRAICKMIDYIAKYFNIDYKNMLYELDELCKIRMPEGGFKYIYKHTWEQTKAKLCDCLNPLIVNTTFYISINPLDYLTMSHGEHWESCHSMRDDGCYHAATVTSLVDSSTIIVYTLSDSNRPEKDFWEADKLTREMIFLARNLDGIFQQVFYPDKSTNDAEIVRNILQQMLASYANKPNLWKNIPWENASIHSREFLGYHDWEEGKKSICSILTDEAYFKIGEEAPCIDDHDSSVCENEYISYGDYESYCCEHCGQRLSEDEAYFVDGQCFCEECYNEFFVTCERCNESVDKDYVIYIDDEPYCEYCASKLDYRDTEDGYTTQNYIILLIDGDEVYYKYEDNLKNDCPNAVKCDECGNWFVGEGDVCPNCEELHAFKEKLNVVKEKINRLDESSEMFQYKDEFIALAENALSIPKIKELIERVKLNDEEN